MTLETRAQLLAAANVPGDGIGNGAVRFIMQARAMINELLNALFRARSIAVADEENTLP